MNQSIRVDIKTSQKIKQLGWFISNYSNIFNDSFIYLYFYNIPVEALDFSTVKTNKVKSIIFQNLLNPFTVEEIRNLEAFNSIVVPFKNKMPESLLKVFISNLDKIRDKSKIICQIDSSNFDEFEKIGRVVKFCLSCKFFKFSISGFSVKSTEAIKIFIERNGGSIEILPKDIKYQIDEQGNILNPKTKQTLSTIYKYPGFLIFN